METLRKLAGEDNSIKYLFQLDDKNTIETLYMYDKDSKLTYHSTVCVSSQVGCSMGCKFCATGMQGFIRNLSVDEIIEQVNTCNIYCSNQGIIPIDAVVFAGMGEPLLNYENVKAAILEINSRFGIKCFELATVGIVPQIYSMIEDFTGKDIFIRLNLSLHASSDDKRKMLIPYTSKHDIHEIICAAVDYAKAFNTKVRIRYMLIKGVNDSDEDIARLKKLLGNKPVKLVISQYNDNDIQGLIAPEQSEIQDFHDKISKSIECEIFHNFGSRINGGCGQLRQTGLNE